MTAQHLGLADGDPVGRAEAVSVEVFVPGKPAPQGSKRYIGRSGGKGVVVESSKAVAPWRADVREHILAAAPAPQDSELFPSGVAVRVDLEFVLPRHTSTPKKRTPLATKRPDCDKLRL